MSWRPSIIPSFAEFGDDLLADARMPCRDFHRGSSILSNQRHQCLRIALESAKCRPTKFGSEAIQRLDDLSGRASNGAQGQRAFFDAIRLRVTLANKLLAALAGGLLHHFLNGGSVRHHFSQLTHALLAGLLEDLLDGVFDNFARDGNLRPGRLGSNERDGEQKSEDW